MIIRSAVLFLIATASAWAQAPGRLNPPHLAEMPAVDRVLREITAPDPREAAARRAGAFEQLSEIIAELSSGRIAMGNPTPDEQRIRNEYGQARIDAMKTVYRGPEDDFFLRRYDEDLALRAELLAKFFSPAFRAQSTAISNELQAGRAVMRANNEAFGGAAIQQPTAAPSAPAAAGAFGIPDAAALVAEAFPGIFPPTQAAAPAAPSAPDPSFARARAAGVDTKVFGLELGEPLALPQCGLADALSVGRSCANATDPFGIASAVLAEFDGPKLDLTDIKLAAAVCPAWVSTCVVTAMLDGGRLIGIDIPTDGPKVAAAVARELSGKYGLPTSSRRSTVTPDDGGAKFETTFLSWSLNGLYVELQPVLKVNEDGAVKVNVGLVRIEGERARAQRSAVTAERERPRL